jgi:hypothetical protein
MQARLPFGRIRVPLAMISSARPGALRLPRDAVFPDYGTGGLFGLVHAIRGFLDGDPWALPGDEPSTSRENSSPVLVFLLIDGLGDAFLQRFGAGSVLLAHRLRKITSVFPSTTASAVTTVLTGLSPAEHGLTGWFIHDRRFGGLVAPLPMAKRASGPLHREAAAARLFPYPSLFQNRARKSIFITPKRLAFSLYSQRHGRGAALMPYRGIAGMVDAITDAVAELKRRGGGYVHAYYPVFDALSHAHGCASGPVIEQFFRIDAAFAALLDRLAGSGAEVVASADHGFLDSPPQRVIHLDRDREAAAMLAAPLFGERRTAFCEVRPGAAREFAAFVGDTLAGKAVLVGSPAFLQSGILGPGKRHPRLHERTGTHTLLMEPGWTIVDRVPGERPHRMIGVHGGLSPQEMWVPLIRACC